MSFKTEWDLKSLYYKNENDPRILSDIEEAERSYTHFAKTYKGGAFLKTNSGILKALTAYETLAGNPAGRRALYYFSYRHSLNVSDSVAEKRLNVYESRLTKAGNQIVFFDLLLGELPKIRQKELLADSKLSHFHYFLSCVFEEAKHTLSESEEKILNITSQTASGMWAQATEKIISSRLVVHEGKKIAIPEALERINTLKPSKKQKLWDSVLNELEQISEVAENEFTAIGLYKKNLDELRSFAKPYSATILSYENNEKSIEALIHAISTKGFALSKRFYALKASYQGVKKIPYVQRYNPIGKSPTYSFEESVKICREVFYGTHTEFGEFFDMMLKNGQIDVFPKEGKRGGAFMSSGIGIPTLVFLNHTNDLASLTTLAHEMGHAIHSMKSKKQSPLYEEYSTTTSETASTLFENILFDKLIADAPEKQKLSLLHERIMRTLSSIERQTAFFNFELEFHTRIREEGALTKIELRDMMTKHLRSYLGDSVEVTERDGYSYVYIAHFRYGFYVYTYAYGELMSMYMAEKLKSDPEYISQISKFLELGGSDTVENIFKKIGIDALSEKTFLASLTRLENYIDEFERLTTK